MAAEPDNLTLLDAAGRRIDVDGVQPDGHGGFTARGPRGRRLVVPAHAVEGRDGSEVRLSLAFTDAAEERTAERDEQVLPLVEERLETHTRPGAETTVRVRAVTREHEETVEEVLRREDVHVQHVPIDRFVDEASPVREEGETVIVPLYEEVLVVEKRLLLREELHLTKRSEDRTETRSFRLRAQDAEIERIESDEA